MKPESTRGGKRKGAGRHKQKETVVVSVRILKEFAPSVKLAIKKEVLRLKSL